MPPDDHSEAYPEDTPADTTDADAEAFAEEWLEYKKRVDFLHNLFTTEPEAPHWFFRPLISKKKK